MVPVAHRPSHITTTPIPVPSQKRYNGCMTSLTPKEIVTELDKYIVGQTDAKRAVAIAVRNRWRRQQLPADVRRDVSPKNILMIGPTGVGKTEIARRLAGLVGAPFIKVEATKYTEVGYHGRDVESMVRDLLDVGIDMVRRDSHLAVKESALVAVEDRLLDLLLPTAERGGFEDEEAKTKRQRTREHFRQQLRESVLEDRPVELVIDQKADVNQLFGAAGMDMGFELQAMMEKMLPGKRETKRMTVADARRFLQAQESDKMVDSESLNRQAIELVEQSGIIFLDEIDKIAGAEKSQGPDVSRQGVQRDLLPIVEGSTITTKHGPVRSDHILFIAAGAFSNSKPSDLMPELLGRFPIRVELSELGKDDFVRILTEPQNSLIKQTVLLLATEGVKVDFTEGAIDAIASVAWRVNRKTQNIGARRLYTILERVFETISFEAPDTVEKQVQITREYVKERMGSVVKDEDLSKFVL
jgi:ATP-dependent HslUV protease ATP-binding subunit HslU